MKNRIRQFDSQRSGFSLVELMIVIGLIALLVTILVIAIGPSIENARIAATRTTITQINAVIQDRMDAISRLDVSVEAKRLAALNSGIDQKEAEFLLRKNLYRQALPQRIEDLQGMDLASGGGDDAPFITTLSTPGEVFFHAITQGNSLRVIPDGKTYTVPTLALDNINPAHLKDNDGDGTPDVFIDEWNKDLVFYNFPTRLIKEDGIAITANDLRNAQVLIAGLPNDTSANGQLNTDPLDPSGILIQDIDGPTDPITLNYAPSASWDIRFFDETTYHTPGTYYVPLLVSGGPDQVTGLEDPDDGDETLRLCRVKTFDDITDNITNRQQ